MSAYSSRVPAKVRILVVDDHPAVREGLALLVSSEGIETCSQASTHAEALAQVAHCRPDMAIVDLSLDGEDGLTLVHELTSARLPVLVYSMHSDAQHVEAAFAAGALGYVTKSEFRGALVEAIRSVAAHRRFLSPRAASAAAELLPGAKTDDSLKALSAKEREVYRLVGTGDGTGQIAAALGISTHTVESYYSRIQVKLDLEGMYEHRRHAIDHFRGR